MTLRVQVVGGFLGAGKTTLLRAAARWLADRGERVAIVTNDQGHALVDTALCSRTTELAREIPGGCFCCRYPELEEALDWAERAGATVVLAEAVGSCTDLVATVLAPLVERRRGSLSLGPLAVVVDPFRATEMARRDVRDDDVAYLFAKQIEEADVVLLSRADLDPPDVRPVVARLAPGAAILAVSAPRALGLEAWLGARPASAARPLAIDYARYAAAEAKLGWLNARVRIVGAHEPAAVLRRFFDAIAAAPIAHVKLTSTTPPGAHAAVTHTGASPFVSLEAIPPSLEASEWLLNARVAVEPATLRALVQDAMVRACAPRIVTFADVECFQPSPPVPTHRLALRVLSDASSCAPLVS